MFVTVTEKAAAKINLTLDITGRREDGYHTLDSIMHTVELFDTLDVTYDEFGDGIILLSDSPNMPLGMSNLCCKAALAYRRASGIRGGIVIELDKKIPVSAGLAGGSADCAATLRALDRIFPGRLSEKELHNLAASLGADVPFCLVGGCMRAQGIGEVLTPLPGMPDIPLVIARLGPGISAKEAYELFDKAPVYTHNTETMVNALESDKNIVGLLANAFEDVVFEARPRAAHLCECFSYLNALDYLMSGSGDAVYALFENEYYAVIAREALRRYSDFVCMAYPYYAK